MDACMIGSSDVTTVQMGIDCIWIICKKLTTG